MRVFFVEENESYSIALDLILRSSSVLQVVGHSQGAASVDQLAAAIIDADPDALITDVKLHCCDALELCRAIKTRAPEISILGLIGFLDSNTVRKLATFGVDGFLPKGANRVELEDAVKAVRHGATIAADFQNVLSSSSQAG